MKLKVRKPTSESTTQKKKKNEATSEILKSQEMVRLHAYYNFLDRMQKGIPGNQMTDWIEAEKIVQSHLNR